MKQFIGSELAQMATAQQIFSSDLAAGLGFFISSTHKSDTEPTRLTMDEQ
jgi:hypothetical protein